MCENFLAFQCVNGGCPRAKGIYKSCKECFLKTDCTNCQHFKTVTCPLNEIWVLFEIFHINYTKIGGEEGMRDFLSEMLKVTENLAGKGKSKEKDKNNVELSDKDVDKIASKVIEKLNQSTDQTQEEQTQEEQTHEEFVQEDQEQDE